MNLRWLWIALAAASVGFAGTAAGQGAQLEQPQLRDDEQILPSQIVQPPPRLPAKPTKPTGTVQAAPSAQDPPHKPALAALPPASKPAEPAHVVACSGMFAKNSGHLKLAVLLGAQNVDYAEVSGDEGGTLMASVLYPKDPKRRLEVVWDDEASRSGTSLIVITGQSTWGAPKGLRLGLPLAALEKLNGKPFKLKGLDKNGRSQVSDWDGGGLASLPGDCKVGIFLKPDAKASADARAALTSDKELASDDAAVKAAKPTVAEILLGY
jgi:hypothetical protein